MPDTKPESPMAVVTAVPVMEMTRENVPAPGTAQWKNGVCGCCDHKDCGALCCCQFFCCNSCIWGSTLGKSGLSVCGVEDDDSLCWATICISCCFRDCCCPCIWSCSARQELAKQKGIEESDFMACFLSFCCYGCSVMQMTHEIMTDKNLTFSCASGAVPDLKESLNPGGDSGVDVVVNVK